MSSAATQRQKPEIAVEPEPGRVTERAEEPRGLLGDVGRGRLAGRGLVVAAGLVAHGRLNTCKDVQL